MTALEEIVTRAKRDLHENREKRLRCQGARELFRPATWAEEASTVYQFVRPLEELGLTSMAMILFNLMEFPSLSIIHRDQMDFYLDVLAASPFRIPPGNLICTYEDIFTRLAPTVQTLLIVDDGNRFLDHLREQGKTVKNFFQWSVGDYPLPNLHTHLIFQPTAKDA